MQAKAILIIFFLINTCSLFGQKEDYQWVFRLEWGDSLNNLPRPELRPLLGGSILDFNDTPPSSFRTEKLTLNFFETNAALCDQNGKLLLYSNGQAIHGPDFKPIVNGDRINFGPRWEQFSWDTDSGIRPKGFFFPQLISIVQRPDYDNEFFLFYKNYDDRQSTSFNSLLMAKIIYNGDGELEVIEKDILIWDRIDQFGHTNLCQHANGRDWWMIQVNRDKADIFLVDPEGIQLVHEQDLGVDVRSFIGSAKFNKEGSVFAIHGLYSTNSILERELAIFDFDRCSGMLSNGKLKVLDEAFFSRQMPLEFSPNGQFIYINTHLEMYQYDLLSDDVFESKLLVAEFDGFDIDLLGNNNSPSQFGMTQRGPDDKLYNVASGQGLGIHIIHNPNERGVACNFEHRGIILPTYVYHTVPNHNTLRLGPIDDSFCDTLGIDNNPFARFRYEQDTTEMLDIDFVDLSYYRPEFWQWDFGDGMISSEQYPSHVYEKSGIYNVCLTVSNENSSHTTCDTLNLGISDVSEALFDFKITVFPNPVEDYCRIAFHNYIPNNAHIKILDSQGQTVMQNDLEVRDQVIDLTSLNSGIYFYEIIDKGSVIKSGKLVKI